MAKQTNPIAEKELKLRKHHWPKVEEEWLWNSDDAFGYRTLPKTMPLILQIMDDLSNHKPVSSTYLELWCRDFNGYSFVTVSNPQPLAFASGFRGQRGLTAWRERIKILRDLNFIDTKKGTSGEFHYILIYNPHRVIQEHYKEKTSGLREDSYNALYERALELKMKDFD